MRLPAIETYNLTVQTTRASNELFLADVLTDKSPSVVMQSKTKQERFGLLFYKESDGGPLQANFAELPIIRSQTLYEHMSKLNPACNTGTMLYLSRVKLPAARSKVVFENEYISTTNYGGHMWVQDTMAVIAVKLVFDEPRRSGIFSGDFFEYPIIYKGKTELTHARLKPTDWGNLSEIAPIELAGAERYDERYWMPLLAS